MIDSVFRTGENYYPQVFLEECKYVVKGKKIPKYIIDDIEISSDSDKENSDGENSSKELFDEEKKVFFPHIKIVNKYYQKNKEKLRKKVRERYQNLFKQKKIKDKKKVPDRYQNLPK